MRRLQFFIDEESDDRLERQAALSGTSKAALIRAAIDEVYGSESAARDPIDALVGAFDGPARTKRESIDDVVYGA